MEALLKPTCSTISLRKYSPNERGYLTSRGSLCFTTRRRTMPVSYLRDIHRKWNVKKSFELSALADDQEHIEKLPKEKYVLESEISSKHEDGNTILLKKLKTFVEFCRPYALVGIVSGVLSISLLPVQSIADLSHPGFFMGLVQALVLGVLLQLYMIAVNDLFDGEIDKINKQHYAMASGEFSQGDVMAICVAVTILSIGIVFMSKSPALLGAFVVNFVTSTGYSANLPFLRWKKHFLLTMACMVTWMAFAVQIPHFIHIQKYVLGRPNIFPKLLIFQTLILCMNTIAVVTIKDVPDVDGDRENGIETFSTRFGVERAFAFGVNVLFAQFGLGMVAGVSASHWFGKLITVLGHLALALVVWYRARHTDPTNKPSAQSFYMLVWQVVSIEYLLIHFAR